VNTFLINDPFHAMPRQLLICKQVRFERCLADESWWSRSIAFVPSKQLAAKQSSRANDLHLQYSSLNPSTFGGVDACRVAVGVLGTAFALIVACV
jgi:hypothetical protein